MNALDLAVLRSRACKVESVVECRTVTQHAAAPIDQHYESATTAVAQLRVFESIVDKRLTAGEARLLAAEARIAKLEQYFRKDTAPLTAPPNESDLEYHPSMRRVLATVSHFYEIPAIDMQSDRRDKRSTVARQVFMYLCRRLTPLSLHVIGAFVRKKDHTTVMHGIRVIEQRRQFDQTLDEELETLTRALK